MYHLFSFFLQNWFHNRRKKEALQLERNDMTTKFRQNRSFLKDNCAYRQSQINSDKYIKKSTTTRHLNFSNIGVCRLVPVNNDNEKKARKKSVAINQKCQNTLSTFAVTQDENGVVILHEL